MIFSFLVVLAVCLGQTSSLAVTTITTTPPQITSLARRAAIPTFTLGPKDRYFPSQASDAEPSGTSLQIFPTGTYDDFPKDGITIAIGAELRKQIKDATASACNAESYTQECQDALMPILHKTDLATHTKRFVVIGAIGAISLTIAVAAMIIHMGQFYSSTKEVPSNVKLNHGDLAQIKSMSGAPTFAVVAATASATANTIVWQPAATTASPNFITIETLSADKDDHKAGDVVYHIPQDAATRINDFLAMTGIKETQNICKGQALRRADSLAECLQHIQRHAMDLADAGPANLLQLAQQNIPAQPAAGQAIGLAVGNLATDGIPLIIPVYRVLHEHAPQRAPANTGWDPVALVKSATAVAIAAHAALVIGGNVVEIWISKDKLFTDLKEEKLACPKNMLCVSDECKGQEDTKNLVNTEPYCKMVSNFGCKCRPVSYGHGQEVEGEYMYQQYEYLEQLIKKATLPAFAPVCDQGDQKLDDASKMVSTFIDTFCKDNADLKLSFMDVKTLQPGFTFSFFFTKKNGDCGFDCKALFGSFVESDACISGSGMQKNGEIKMECGTASYVGYNLV